MTVISIMFGGQGKVSKKPVKETGELGIRERIETIQTTTQLRLARILKRIGDGDTNDIRRPWKPVKETGDQKKN